MPEKWIMKDISIGISGDYAVLSFDSGSFYYGYEVTECLECGYRGYICKEHPDSNAEWCFKAEINETVWIYPWPELMTDDVFSVTENLLAGIGKWMNENQPL
jgi:hypothetical protein